MQNCQTSILLEKMAISQGTEGMEPLLSKMTRFPLGQEALAWAAAAAGDWLRREKGQNGSCPFVHIMVSSVAFFHPSLPYYQHLQIQNVAAFTTWSANLCISRMYRDRCVSDYVHL